MVKFSAFLESFKRSDRLSLIKRTCSRYLRSSTFTCCLLSGGGGGRGDAVESPKISFSMCHNISQNIASNSHCFGHTNPRATGRSPCKFKRVYMRVHRRNGGQSYHRPPVNSSEFLVQTKMGNCKFSSPGSFHLSSGNSHFVYG